MSKIISLTLFVLFVSICDSFGQDVRIAERLAGGIVFQLDTAAKKVLVVSLDMNQTRYIWNDAINEIRIHNDSTEQNWRLPTRMELEELYQLQDEIPQLSKAIYWSSEVDATYDAYQDRQGRASGTSASDAMDGALDDYGSHRDEYVRTLNFYSGVLEWKRKSDLCRLIMVRTVDLTTTK
jgi:hypothetical protein